MAETITLELTKWYKVVPYNPDENYDVTLSDIRKAIKDDISPISSIEEAGDFFGLDNFQVKLRNNKKNDENKYISGEILESGDVLDSPITDDILESYDSFCSNNYHIGNNALVITSVDKRQLDKYNSIEDINKDFKQFLEDTNGTTRKKEEREKMFIDSTVFQLKRQLADKDYDKIIDTINAARGI